VEERLIRGINIHINGGPNRLSLSRADPAPVTPTAPADRHLEAVSEPPAGRIAFVHFGSLLELVLDV
jgi:hypothetical protein